MIIQFKLFENINGWTFDKIRSQLKLGDGEVLNPMDIKYNLENKELYDNIKKYFCWKYKIDNCYISYFFNNEETYLGAKFLDDNNNTYMSIISEDDSEIINFLNEPEMFIQMNKYNL